MDLKNPLSVLQFGAQPNNSVFTQPPTQDFSAQSFQQDFISDLMKPTGINPTVPKTEGGGFMDAFSNLFGGADSTLGSFGDFAGGVCNIAGGGSSIMGMVNAGKDRKFAERSYADQLSAYNQNAKLQGQSMNTFMEDRQIARASAMSPDQYAALYGSTEDYMDKNRVVTKNIG